MIPASFKSLLPVLPATGINAQYPDPTATNGICFYRVDVLP
jgi:hypothetical protein